MHAPPYTSALGLQRTIAPTALPVTRDELKAHLRITHDDEDTLLDMYLRAAVNSVEEICGRAILTQTWVWTLDTFPAPVLEVPRPLLQAVTSIAYDDSFGQARTLDPSLYQVDTSRAPGRIMEAYSTDWPDTYDVLGAVRITFRAGWANPNAVPDEIKLAVMMQAGHLYEHRESFSDLVVHEVAGAISHLLSDFTIRRV